MNEVSLLFHSPVLGEWRIAGLETAGKFHGHGHATVLSMLAAKIHSVDAVPAGSVHGLVLQVVHLKWGVVFKPCQNAVVLAAHAT